MRVHRSPSLLSAALMFGLSVLLVCAPYGVLRGQASPPSQTQTVTIDVKAPTHPFPHYWEQMFGSGRAILSLRDSYRRDLRAVKRATGFEYIRFHGILLDEVGLYNEDAQGRPVYNFSYVDQIYDGLLQEGVRPFVELSFMPEKLASTSSRQAFWYKPYNSSPRDWDRWSDLMENFGRHLVARYGIDEVSNWYFEVWNEPNIDFWAGEPKQATYFRLYDVTARALKRVSPSLRVGGPATAQAAWVGAFIRHAVEDRVPLDFVSTHVYANDTAHDVFGTHEIIPRDQMVYRAVKKVHDEVKASSRPDLPIIFSEYNASYMNEVDVTDSEFLGPWLANTIRQCDGLVDSLAYWAFSDVFEEQGVVKRPFYGGFGLMAAGHIPKASYNAFRLLHRLGTERLAVDSDSVLATRRADGSLAIAVWNFAPPGDSGSVRELTLIFTGLEGPQVKAPAEGPDPAGAGRRERSRRVVWISRVDHDHGSSLAAWQAMGSPDFPTRDEQERLRDAGKLSPPEIRRLAVTSPAKIAVTVPPHGIMLLEIQKSAK